MTAFLLNAATVTAEILKKSLPLHLSPGSGYPVSIELPSGSDIKVVEKQHDWVRVQDQRNATGWAKSSVVREAGGLDELIDWHWREQEGADIGALKSQYMMNSAGPAWSAGWVYGLDDAVLEFEYSRSASGEGSYQQASLWAGWALNLSSSRYALIYSVGAGLADKEDASDLFSSESSTQSSFLVYGGKIDFQMRINHKISSGVSYRSLVADLSESRSEDVYSWYWLFRI